MKRSAFCVSVLLLFPWAGEAQQWNPQQQEVVEHLEACWDVWQTGIEMGSPDRWLMECATEDFKGWGGATPQGADVERRMWPFWMEQEWKWISIVPTDILIHGDVAVMHFFGGWQYKDGGQWTLDEGKRTEVYRRVDGRWRFWAGHYTAIVQDLPGS